MPRNGSGTFTLSQAAFVSGTTISSAAVNSDLSDIASALTASLPRDGQAGMTGQFKTVDGTVAVPSHSFSSEAATGFYRPSAGKIGIAIAGVSIGYFDSTGFVGSVPSLSIPFGMIADFSGTTAPAKWLICAGQAVSRVTYAILFSITGTVYGAGNGSTTFNVPDLRGTTTVGKDDMGGSASSRLTTAFFGTDPTGLGNRGGVQSRALSTTNLPAYTPSGTVAVSNVSTTFGARNTGVGGTSILTEFALGSSNATSAGSMSSASGSATAAFTGSVQGGSSTAFGTIQPSLVVNKIIYAGV